MKLAQLVGIAMIAVLLVCGGITGRILTLEYSRYQQAQQGHQALELIRATLDALILVSKERGPSNGLLGSDIPLPAERVELLLQARSNTDAAFARINSLLDNGDYQQRNQILAVLKRLQSRLAAARKYIDHLSDFPRAQRTNADIQTAVNQMIALIPLFSPALNTLEETAGELTPELSDRIMIARLAAELRDQAGQLGSVFAAPISLNRALTESEQFHAMRLMGSIDAINLHLRLDYVRVDAPELLQSALQAVDEVYLGKGYEFIDHTLTQGRVGGRYGMDMAEFTRTYVPTMTPIVNLVGAAMDSADQLDATLVRSIRQTLLMNCSASIGACLVTALVFWLIRNRFSGPLVQLCATMRQLADGQTDIQLPLIKRADEIGDLSMAVGGFRDALIGMQRLQTELEHMARTDHLTGLGTRRYFMETAEREISRARRYNDALSLISLDIDRFKSINDNWGHQVGDQALRLVADTCRGTVRDIDIIGRIGGEEFVILLQKADLELAIRTAERLRAAIAQTQLDVNSTTIALTASLGVAMLEGGDYGLDDLMSRADHALYQAKHNGRNRVEVAKSAPNVRPQSTVTEV